MTIDMIKGIINGAEGTQIETLLMQQQEATLPGSTEVVATDWFSHWENSKRVRITMHGDVFRALKANRAKADMVAKREEVKGTATRVGYIHYFIVVPKDIAGVF